jgi:glycerol-1-phosphate dehydrogenase [NAD(P)+]
VGTLIAARLYEGMQQISPDREKGLAYAQGFDKQAWFAELAAFLGNGADDMIALDAKEQKYAVEKHAERLERIIEHWDVLTEIMKEEIPTAAFIAALLDKIGCPKTVEAWGLSSEILPMTFKSTKDIRDKYVLSRLAFDLGILEETAALCSGAEQGA